ncbi:MAG: insulinase family protein [Prevotellaceae bacterium]|jgi:predicted Zn-dependent peptidase|nr:insulinase family protein [Prevotellaceae bacterium]
MTIHTLKNGIRLLHIQENLPVAYCGFAVNAGTRDELENEDGLAHFLEHLLFKGTKKRKSLQIINRLEEIGGELDAYTTKEETFIYAVTPEKYVERAVELLADVMFNSTFPADEIAKERSVVEDEIQSYKDSPSELIFDDFEELVFENSALGHNILGKKKTLRKFNAKSLQNFIKRCYTTDNLLFFIQGNIDFEKVLKFAEKYFDVEKTERNFTRTAPQNYVPQSVEKSKKTFQIHCLIGNTAFSFGHKNRLAQALLNNIIGGSMLSSRLNIAVRERNGLVYSIDSSLNPYTDTGVWNIYFGCDKANFNKCNKLIYNELHKMREKPLTSAQLEKAKRQFAGQLLISAQNRENRLLAAAKSALHRNYCNTEEQTIEKLKAVSIENLYEISQEMFDIERLTVLKYI